MPKEAWSSLSDDAKKIWDQLPPEDKAKILNASVERAKKKITSVNNHELEHGQDEEEASMAGLQVNKTTVADGENGASNTKEEAHPGDVRAMMSSNKKTTSVKNVTFHTQDQEDAVDGYWRAHNNGPYWSDDDSDSDF